MKPTYKNGIVRNYIRRFPTYGTRTIARKIWQENSKEFNSYETVKSMVAYVRGLSGEKNRRKLGDKSLVVEKFTFKNPYCLPKAEKVKSEIFTLPATCNNILILSDIHIPYHDNTALTAALRYGKEQKINTIVINGDLLDFYQISKFINLERRRSVAEELDIAKQFLGILNKEFTNVPIYFLMGNHDNRLEMYLATHAPELLDVEEFKLAELLEAEAFNMTVLKDTTRLKAGKLNITHGHILLRGFFAPVNPARGTFLRAKASTLIGHTHKKSEHTENTMNGKTISCYSTGCLCELLPTYAPYPTNNYVHGFAHIIINKNKFPIVKNIQIVDGEIWN